MNGPLIVQSDKTVLLEVDHAQAAEARAALSPRRTVPTLLLVALLAAAGFEPLVLQLVRTEPAEDQAFAAARKLDPGYKRLRRTCLESGSSTGWNLMRVPCTVISDTPARRAW